MPVEELLIDVYFHFKEYREFLEFCDWAPLKILKYACMNTVAELGKIASTAFCSSGPHC